MRERSVSSDFFLLWFILLSTQKRKEEENEEKREWWSKTSKIWMNKPRDRSLWFRLYTVEEENNRGNKTQEKTRGLIHLLTWLYSVRNRTKQNQLLLALGCLQKSISLFCCLFVLLFSLPFFACLLLSPAELTVTEIALEAPPSLLFPFWIGPSRYCGIPYLCHGIALPRYTVYQPWKFYQKAGQSQLGPSRYCGIQRYTVKFLYRCNYRDIFS